MNKKSFFERLAGNINLNADNYDEEETNILQENLAGESENSGYNSFEPYSTATKNKRHHDDAEGHLTIDMYETSDDIVIQSIIAGIKEEDLDVSITRDMITIKGRRPRPQEAQKDNYLCQELYWGYFSRVIIPPEEIDVDGAEAALKNGMLKITLPKIKKDKIQKLSVKNNE